MTISGIIIVKPERRLEIMANTLVQFRTDETSRIKAIQKLKRR